MTTNPEIATAGGSGGPVVGIRTDVYERRLELIWMSKDDIENFESRIQDKTLFQNLALGFLSASIPLLAEKGIDYSDKQTPTDFAIIVVCAVAIILGVIFQSIALSRRRKLKTFRDQLFKRESKLSTTYRLVDTSSSAPDHGIKNAI